MTREAGRAKYRSTALADAVDHRRTSRGPTHSREQKGHFLLGLAGKYIKPRCHVGIADTLQMAPVSISGNDDERGGVFKVPEEQFSAPEVLPAVN